ncbi:MAG: SAM-dependent DNA methyltransferase [Pseudomonadota bacterium]
MNAPTAVMASRASPQDALDLFPTPPWSTRALPEEVLLPRGWMRREMTCWDPCCGKGHMTLPLREYFSAVFASDVFDWGFGDRRDLDFAFAQAGDAPFPVDWIFMNPPFVIAESMLTRALSIATTGVAMLLRLAWLEGGERYRLVYEGPNRPQLLCPFADRVPMIEGVWDPEASSATAYAWFVWLKRTGSNAPFAVEHIRPGAVSRYGRLSDLALATPGEAERRRLAKKKVAK